MASFIFNLGAIKTYTLPDSFDNIELMIKEYQILIGLLAIALAIYLGLITQHNNIVNVSAKTELDSCLELTEEMTGDRRKALELCALSIGS